MVLGILLIVSGGIILCTDNNIILWCIRIFMALSLIYITIRNTIDYRKQFSKKNKF